MWFPHNPALFVVHYLVRGDFFKAFLHFTTRCPPTTVAVYQNSGKQRILGVRARLIGSFLRHGMPNLLELS
jgi:hypothetical protein